MQKRWGNLMLKGYKKYKEIPEFWLPSMPSNWDCIKIKHIFKERVEKGYPDKPLLAATQNLGVVPKNLYGNRTVEALKDLHLLKLVKMGDFVISLRSFQGGIEYAYYEGIISPAYTIMIPNDNNANFFRYLFKSVRFVELLQNCVTGIREGQNIDYSKLRNHLIPIPSRSEQDKIVRYLDWKVSMINKYINAKKKQIELLREQRQAVINKILMRREDGWEYKSLKYWAKSNLSSLGSNTDLNYKLEYLDISSVGHGFVKQEPTQYTFGDAPSRARRIVQYGDTIISNVRTYLRSVCFINHDIEHCIVSTGFSVLTPNKNMVLPELLSFVLSTNHFIDETIRNSVGVSYPAINDNKLMCLKVALPHSLRKQELLCSIIKGKFNIFEEYIQKIQQQVFLMQEFRTRLISDVVTGKVDVQGQKVPKFTTGDENISKLEVGEDYENNEFED